MRDVQAVKRAGPAELTACGVRKWLVATMKRKTYRAGCQRAEGWWAIHLTKTTATRLPR